MSDLYIIAGCFLASIVVYLGFGARPRQFYNKVLARIRYILSMRLIAQSELDNLYRQIEALTDQNEFLLTVPIKAEKGTGQQQFFSITDEPEKKITGEVLLGPFWNKKELCWKYQVMRAEDYANWKADKKPVRVEVPKTKKNKKGYTYKWVNVLGDGDVEVPFEDLYTWEKVTA